MLQFPESDEPLEWQVRKPLLYLSALIVSVLLISGGWYYVTSTEQKLQRRIQEHWELIKTGRDAGLLPRALDRLDIDGLTENMQKKPPRDMEKQLERAHFLRDNGFALVPLTIGLCLGLAWVTGRVFPVPK
jgi:hypothetical protein